MIGGLVTALALAQDRPDGRRLAAAHWTTDDGLTQNSVTDLLEDARGFLWVATFGGLCRFDGVRFACFDLASEGLPTTRITALAAGPDGLWLGVQDAGLVVLRGDRFTAVPVTPAVDRTTTHDLAVDAAGVVWAATDAGLARWSPTGGGRLYGRAEGLPDLPARAVLPDVGGAVWVGSRGGLARVDGDRVVPVWRAPDVFGVSPAPDGRIWALATERYAAFRDGVLEREWPGKPPTTAAWSVDPAGRTWVCDRDLGVSEVTAGGLRPLVLPGTPQPECRSLLADREGSLWLGSDVDGLTQLRDRSLALYERPAGVGAVFEGEPGELWLGGCLGLERWTEASGFVPVLAPGATCVRAFARAPDGAVLVGADDRVLRFAGDAPMETVPAGGLVYAILPEPDGALLVGRHDGVVRLRPGAAPEPVAAFGDLRVNVLRRDGDDVLAGGDDGVARWRPDGSLVRFDPASLPDFPRGAVRDLLVDREAGGVWVGTYGGGLALLREGPGGPTVRTLTVRDGLPENVVSRMLPDGAGQLWVNGNLGVSSLDLGSLRAVARGGGGRVGATLYAGVEGNGGSGDAGVATRAGDLWFPNLRGLTRVSPASAAARLASAPPLAVVLESVTVHGQRVLSGARVPPVERRDLEATFTAPTFVDPRRVRFQHRLVGYDADWRESEGRTVTYTNLPPGDYQLEVRAQDRAGRWSPVAAHALALLPSFGERPGVRVLAVVGLALLAALVASFALRATRARSQQLEAEVERRRVSEEAIREREARYHTVFDGAEDALVLYDGQGRLREVNPAGAALLGGVTDPALLLDGAEAQAAFRSGLAATRAGRGPAVGESAIRAPDRAPGVVRWRIAPFPLDGRVGALVAFTDLTAIRAAETERLDVQDRLQRAQTMEALGQLAGGVAHDFNNLLTVISGSAGLLLEGAPVAPLAADILASANRGAELVRRLLVIGKRQPHRAQPVAVGALVAGLERVVRASLPDDVTLDLRVDPEAVALTDPAHLECAVLNLVLNARDAMPDGGTLAIAVSREQVGPEALATLTDPGARAGAWLVVSVADTGTGIPRELLDRIFVPFFTTKPVGQGSGLGLSVVQSVVQRSGGFVDVASSPAGSRFRLFLPLADTPAPAATGSTAPPRPDLAGVVVLVCDDQPEVLQTTARMLKRWRATVLAAAGPEEALRLAESHREALTVLVTDVVMPGMKGPELARRLRELRPGLPVLFLSGDTRNAETGTDLLLGKPYSSAELADALRRVLGR